MMRYHSHDYGRQGDYSHLSNHANIFETKFSLDGVRRGSQRDFNYKNDLVQGTSRSRELAPSWQLARKMGLQTVSARN